MITIELLKNHSAKFQIITELASKLIAQQFPEFSHLTIKPVECSGHCKLEV